MSLTLPGSAHFHVFPDGRELVVLGTAHVSKRSVTEVEELVAAFQPDAIAVELDAARYRNLVEPDQWQKLDIFRVLKEGKAPLLLSSLVMTSFQRRIAKELGIEPGAEMRRGAELAEQTGATLQLIDRDIQTTLRRTWGGLGFFARIKLMSQLVGSLFADTNIDSETIEKLREQEELADMLQSLADALPQVKSSLIDERDVYMAQRLRESDGLKTLAVVGAGHVPGILSLLDADHDTTELETVPTPSFGWRVVRWAIPLAIVGLLVYGFYRGGASASVDALAIWILVNGTLSALGTALALGHPLSVLAAFVAAPITSLNPFLAAGWVAGLVQAWIRRPTVGDLEALPEAITTLKGFWGNPFCRILLVVALANLGSMLGTLFAGGWIAARTF
jgi:pheromone shutdown-related protein TraB